MKKILIIDDDADLLASAKLFLESNQYVGEHCAERKNWCRLAQNFLTRPHCVGCYDGFQPRGL